MKKCNTYYMDKESIIIHFLNICGLICNSFETLDGIQIEREKLLNIERYDTVKENIHLLKSFFSSSILTCLHETACVKQQWPLLNLVRQILKECGFCLKPKRISDGKTKDGKKKYKRIFIISCIQK